MISCAPLGCDFSSCDGTIANAKGFLHVCMPGAAIQFSVEHLKPALRTSANTPTKYAQEHAGMSISIEKRIALICLSTFFAVAAWQAVAVGQDAVHRVSGFLKHVDHDAKTMVVKTADGTEHTIKWTGDTAWDSL